MAKTMSPSGVDYESLEPDMVFAMELSDEAPALVARGRLVGQIHGEDHVRFERLVIDAARGDQHFRAEAQRNIAGGALVDPGRIERPARLDHRFAR